MPSRPWKIYYNLHGSHVLSVGGSYGSLNAALLALPGFVARYDDSALVYLMEVMVAHVGRPHPNFAAVRDDNGNWSTFEWTPPSVDGDG